MKIIVFTLVFAIWCEDKLLSSAEQKSLLKNLNQSDEKNVKVCSENCLDCSLNQCLKCKDDFILFESKCVKNCPEGYNKLDNKCIKVDGAETSTFSANETYSTQAYEMELSKKKDNREFDIRNPLYHRQVGLGMKAIYNLKKIEKPKYNSVTASDSIKTDNCLKKVGSTCIYMAPRPIVANKFAVPVCPDNFTFNKKRQICIRLS